MGAFTDKELYDRLKELYEYVPPPVSREAMDDPAEKVDEAIHYALLFNQEMEDFVEHYLVSNDTPDGRYEKPLPEQGRIIWERVKKVLVCPLEDLPLCLNEDSLTVRIVKRRLKSGK